MAPERLQKILSRAGIASRRQAELFIQEGRVQINGQTITELGARADIEHDEIVVEGKRLSFAKQFHYYAYYKPRGFIVSKKDELGRKTLFDTLQLPPAVNAVGRLDKDSEGLLLLSDDGEFVQRYTHPSFEIAKVYHVQIPRPLTFEEIQQLKNGIFFEEEKKEVRAFRVEPMTKKPGCWVAIELREGLKREIRRMLDFLDIRVLRLIRVRHGEVQIGSLQPGQLQEISPILLKKIFHYR